MYDEILEQQFHLAQDLNIAVGKAIGTLEKAAGYEDQGNIADTNEWLMLIKDVITKQYSSMGAEVSKDVEGMNRKTLTLLETIKTEEQSQVLRMVDLAIHGGKLPLELPGLQQSLLLVKELIDIVPDNTHSLKTLQQLLDLFRN